jgi:hypothetical protein
MVRLEFIFVTNDLRNLGLIIESHVHLRHITAIIHPFSKSILSIRLVTVEVIDPGKRVGSMR